MSGTARIRDLSETLTLQTDDCFAIDNEIGTRKISFANLTKEIKGGVLPEVPSSNGTYTLTATVNGGSVTYEWV